PHDGASHPRRQAAASPGAEIGWSCPRPPGCGLGGGRAVTLDEWNFIRVVDNSFYPDSFQLLMSTSVQRIGVLGATGYTGRELVGLLARHPRAEIVFATSESEAGSPLRRIDRGAPDLELVRSDDAPLGSC